MHLLTTARKSFPQIYIFHSFDASFCYFDFVSVAQRLEKYDTQHTHNTHTHIEIKEKIYANTPFSHIGVGSSS